MDTTKHIPVLLHEVLQYLDLQPGDNVIDGTLGGGGHAEAILERTGPHGKYLGVDVDEEAIARARVRLKRFGVRVTLTQGNFRNLKTIRDTHFPYPVHVVLLDLGTSRDQIFDARRGFSFIADGPLDMRLGGKGDASTVSARELVNQAPEAELARIIRKYGEERYASAIAHSIVVSREHTPLETTQELVSCIFSALPHARRVGRVHPATRTFQSLRIAVNQELESLEEALPQMAGLLESRGRGAVITFHSLEDRIVKHWGIGMSRKNMLQAVYKKPVIASTAEQKANPASRSAKLRVYEKI